MLFKKMSIKIIGSNKAMMHKIIMIEKNLMMLEAN